MFIKKSLLAVALTAIIAFVASAAAQEEKPKPQVLFTNVNIFDGKSDTLAEGMSVLVEGNLIKKIAKGNIEADGATVIDGGGRTLMPGLIDSHVHINMYNDGTLPTLQARPGKRSAHGPPQWPRKCWRWGSRRCATCAGPMTV